VLNLCAVDRTMWEMRTADSLKTRQPSPCSRALWQPNEHQVSRLGRVLCLDFLYRSVL
jgi:hypothetical protein